MRKIGQENEGKQERDIKICRLFHVYVWFMCFLMRASIFMCLFSCLGLCLLARGRPEESGRPTGTRKITRPRDLRES